MKFCQNCQSETERYTGGGCKPCCKKRSLDAYYQTSKPFRTKLTIEQKAVNRKIVQTVYVSKNLEKLRQASRSWNAANKERRQIYEQLPARKAKCVKWYEDNKTKAKKAQLDWTRANPEARRVFSNNRRARKIAAGGQLSKGLALKLFALQRGKCACCGLALGKNYHLDHIVPLALNGSNTDDNMQLLTQRCNNQKSAKDPILFMQSRGFLL